MPSYARRPADGLIHTADTASFTARFATEKASIATSAFAANIEGRTMSEHRTRVCHARHVDNPRYDRHRRLFFRLPNAPRLLLLLVHRFAATRRATPDDDYTQMEEK